MRYFLAFLFFLLPYATHAAVSCTNLTTSLSDVGATSYTTASITPGSSELILASVYSAVAAGTANAPTITGNGLTWVQVNSVVSGSNTLTTLRAMGTASAGTAVIDFAAQSQARAYWSIVDCSGTDTSGTNGSGAVVQSATNKDEVTPNNTTLVVTLAAFGSANNATYGAFRAGNTVGIGSGYTSFGVADGAAHYGSEWQAANDTSVDMTWLATNTTPMGIALEIAAAAPPPPAGLMFDSLVRRWWIF